MKLLWDDYYDHWSGIMQNWTGARLNPWPRFSILTCFSLVTTPRSTTNMYLRSPTSIYIYIYIWGYPPIYISWIINNGDHILQILILIKIYILGLLGPYQRKIWNTRSLEALQAPPSSWRSNSLFYIVGCQNKMCVLFGANILHVAPNIHHSDHSPQRT